VSEPLVAVGAAVVDFDGTICGHDVSEEILRAFAPAEWWEIDLEFQRGEIGSRECLVRQAALLRGRQPEMLEFALSTFSIDPTFPPFVAWAREAGIEVVVASDGFGFYLEPMLRAGGVDGLTILGNRFAADGGAPRLSFPNAHPECVGCGTCKMLAVQTCRRRFGPVAFVGEGHSDRFGALYADVVFAKKHLVDICRADRVPFRPWETFDDVRSALESRQALPGPVAPDRCPGWFTPVGGAL
jgi:2,3-diketo-5-methylthio-1-phosphopentane phosphatase